MQNIKSIYHPTPHEGIYQSAHGFHIETGLGRISRIAHETVDAALMAQAMVSGIRRNWAMADRAEGVRYA